MSREDEIKKKNRNEIIVGTAKKETYHLESICRPERREEVKDTKWNVMYNFHKCIDELTRFHWSFLSTDFVLQFQSLFLFFFVISIIGSCISLQFVIQSNILSVKKKGSISTFIQHDKEPWIWPHDIYVDEIGIHHCEQTSISWLFLLA